MTHPLHFAVINPQGSSGAYSYLRLLHPCFYLADTLSLRGLGTPQSSHLVMELSSPSREVSGPGLPNGLVALSGILAIQALEFSERHTLLETRPSRPFDGGTDGGKVRLREKWLGRGVEEGPGRGGQRAITSRGLGGCLDPGVCGLCSILLKVGD